jgi:radical SAM superfamily enzyme YgiQ (UPF0313 family)
MENCSAFDACFLGESERTLVQFATLLESGDSDFGSIQGIAWRSGDNTILINEKTDFIENPDDIPLPAYELINLSDYYVDTTAWYNPKNLPINTSIPLITSRSCPLRCTFCSMYTVMGPRWRARSPDNVVEELELLYYRYNHRHFSIMDDNFTLNKKRVLEICRLIRERGLNIQFETPNGLNLNSLDAEVLDALVGAGMVRTALAVESGSDYIRNTIMGKHLSRQKILEIVSQVRQYPHLHVSAFFVIGMPEETNETLQETYDMIGMIEADKIQLMNIVPFPGTAVYEQALRDDLLIGLEPSQMYRADDLYFKNSDRFFLKPYQLTLKELFAFRERCQLLISQQQQKRQVYKGV